MNGLIAQTYQDEARVRAGVAFAGGFSYTTAGVSAGNIGVRAQNNLPNLTVVTSFKAASSIAVNPFKLVVNNGASTLTDQGVVQNRNFSAGTSANHLFSGDLALAATTLKLFNLQANVLVDLIPPGEVFVFTNLFYLGIQTTTAAQTLTVAISWYELPN